MTREQEQCQARTKSGAPCRKKAQAGSKYCYVHRNYRVPASEEARSPTTGEDVATIPRSELETLVAELNDLAAELHKLQTEYHPPTYTPLGMAQLLRNNLDRLKPETVRDLENMLADTSLEDFKDFETWKGMWFTLNYLIQLEANERKDSLKRRLAALPGVNTIADMKEMLADTPPEEFLKVDTWKGMWFIANYELQNQARNLRRRLLGAEEK